ncbi:class I SAM-dependent methyltransferase [Streptomyces sp. DSM 44915]|uniref:Class I SAM-dependent methyltransferase n=1 Tax=Streptomyces chisholmiae TaxID=3075540 RepID=A0ABU2JV75_9ACTN|nr:class I SAM-dependent methyltransferase [Streptomyces sp. DSM 44915]MDT0268648.1 class I SAM-dependent methyltransferase [Streptomyces sp. DSM 44915]
MTSQETSSGVFDGDMGRWYASHATDSVYNAYYDRPALLDLIGPCRGLRVLDAGCGAGHYLAELIQRGAEPTGLEGGAELLASARERLGDAVDLRAHDLEKPLDFLADASFDGVLLALVYHHIDARAQLLAEIRRVLRPGGWLVLSTFHPTRSWQLFGGSYFTTGKAETALLDEWTAPVWRMPLEVLFTELLTAGFVVEQVREPRPLPEAAALNERMYRKLSTEPKFLALRLRRP